ncbi:TonB-dependent receptor family protein [Pleionea sediminis]|uniref:TonB-dependent receptor family protein n=1 Tax=Pleionea sediminis TaxID=2569479 RepID=UPI001186D1D7|nr:TonB-dependent receptor [Pleionea sediminis]
MNSSSSTLQICFLTAGLLTFNYGYSSESEDTQKTKDDEYNQRMLIVGKKVALSTEAGSATVLDEEQLEKFEFDDIHRILAEVPGVNIRQEDGYGLRPNIGFRGVTPERSKKINILEDGVLIGPAPYSAPAAYYFPMVSRLTSIEVFKGPAAILYGPNTIAGTLNMQTRQVSSLNEGMFDLSLGPDNYQKTHAYINNSIGDLGLLLEGLSVESDGFKNLDGGGNTGFDKNDIIAKARYNLDTAEYSQVIELKLGYADEVSDETYLGLTDNDFAATPYRRYAATQLAKMDWEHEQAQINHFISNAKFDLTTRIYRNNFERGWRKLNNFQDSQVSLQQILNSPDNAINAAYYDILNGQADSEVNFGKLLIGTNFREFYSQGVQSDLRFQSQTFEIENNWKLGLRYHEDEIERYHTEDTYNMRSGVLEFSGNQTQVTTANTERSEVWSLYVQDTLKFNKWEVTLGVRGEFIDSYYQNNLPEQEENWLKKSTEVWLPGASAFYNLNENSGAFIGVHRGFIPTSPKQDPEIDIEESVNLEFGYRYFNSGTRLELVGFASDFENLKESCTASTSSACFDNIDQEYNAGEAEVIGVEFSYSDRTSISSAIDLPFSIIYTHTQAEFGETFSSDFALWGDVESGDPIPYMPENQLTLTVGLESSDWRSNLLVRYTDSMYEAAGDNVTLSGVTTEPLWVLDFSAAYDFINYGTLYFKIDNLLDETEIISRRPFGARPGKPRQLFAGYKYRW